MRLDLDANLFDAKQEEGDEELGRDDRPVVPRLAERLREIWGDMGRYGEMWGDSACGSGTERSSERASDWESGRLGGDSGEGALAARSSTSSRLNLGACSAGRDGMTPRPDMGRYGEIWGR